MGRLSHEVCHSRIQAKYCPTNVIQIDQATWAIWPAIRKCSLFEVKLTDMGFIPGIFVVQVRGLCGLLYQ